MIPFAISIVVTKEGNYIPLCVALACVVIGLVLVASGKSKSRSVPPRVIEEKGVSPGGMPS